MPNSNGIVYYAATYARASKEDKESPENNTIQNQQELMRDYLKSIPDIRIVSERIDDGYSGVDFLRPDFEKMMKDVKDGVVNCIVVKDFSRLGRNYIEVGQYIENIFPFLGVRFISINDNYDSSKPKSDADDYVIPFKNLMNESYLRDVSVKIRSNLSVKRKRGDFVASFAPYGYIRDSENKNRMAVDEYAAKIVQDIFKWKIGGMSQQGIADKLNSLGEPSPAEYKKQQGLNYTTSLKVNAVAKWSAVAVGRILHNPVYIGTLIQGKQTTPNYKVKKRVKVSEDEWAVVEEAHEAIISKADFELATELLQQDTRIAPQKDKVFPLAGVLFCGDCGYSMIRKTVGKYTYYVCGANKQGNGCSSHSFKESELENAVLQAIQTQISVVLQTEKCVEYIQHLPLHQREVAKSNAQISIRNQEIEKCERYKRSLYEDYKNGDISKEDFLSFNKDYSNRLEELKSSVARLQDEVNLLLQSNSNSTVWIDEFKQNQNVTELSRKIIVHLVERIDVYEGKRITISFRYQDKLCCLQEALQGMSEKQLNYEAVK